MIQIVHLHVGEPPTSRDRIRRLVVGAVVVATWTVLAGAGTARAHISIEPTEIPAGGHASLSMTVQHGCGGGPTEVVRVQIPDGVLSVLPESEPRWETEVVREQLDEPISGPNDEKITEGPQEIVWRGGPLPDGQTLRFEFSLTLVGGAEGDVLYFPAIQECVGGTELAWIERPSDGESSEDLQHPAPSVVLGPPAATRTDGAGGEGTEQDHGDGDGSEGADTTGLDGEETTNASGDDDYDMKVVALVGAALALIVAAGAFATAGRRS